MLKTTRILAAFTALLGAAAAHAQYTSTFESPQFNGSAAGAALSGQDGFYIPDSAQVDGKCYLYAGNELGIVANPTGGTQFIAARRNSADFARAQRNVSFAAADCWFIDLDLNVAHIGALPTANYAGSLSLQPYPEDGSIVILFYWDNVNTAESFNIRVLGFDEGGGTPFLAGLPIPNDGFRNLDANRWYRVSIRIELLTVNAVTGISIRPIDSSETASYVPTDLEGFHLGGGLTPTTRPEAIRLFGGGGFTGDHYAANIVALDNLAIVPTVERPCFADLDLNNQINLQDLAYLLANFGTIGTATYLDGDLDCDRDVDLNDLALLLAQFGIFCA